MNWSRCEVASDRKVGGSNPTPSLIVVVSLGKTLNPRLLPVGQAVHGSSPHIGVDIGLGYCIIAGEVLNKYIYHPKIESPVEGRIQVSVLLLKWCLKLLV